MTNIKVAEFLSYSWIGKKIQVTTDTGKKIDGCVASVSSQIITLVESYTMSQISVELEHVLDIQLGTGMKVDKQSAIQFKNKHNRIAENASLSFVKQFSSRLNSFIETSCNDTINGYVRAELNLHGSSVFPQLIIRYIALLHTLPDNNDSKLIDLMLHYRLHDYSACASILHDILNDPDENQAELICACFFAQCKNGISAYFWLTQYFLRIEKFDLNESDLWWYYLKGCVTYSSYEYTEQLLQKITDTTLAMESIAYLHALNNHTFQALQLIDTLTNESEYADLPSPEFPAWLFYSDNDNHFHRYMRCIAQIVGNDEVRDFENINEVTGYIYDYIPDKGYGFILGNDLLTYFFNREDISAETVMEDIKSNICAFLSGPEERLIKVTFSRSDLAKRTYAAHNIF